ncbi:MAG TPA: hypothetical protein VGI85_12325 [Chthoniobacterales bacterium]|jgi:hypothetical protein
MSSEQKFWRLLADYERLTTDEGVLLRELNLAALARLQAQKTVICDAALEAATAAGLSLPAEHSERLLARQKQNLALTQKQLAHISSERQDLTTATQRLNNVGRAYLHGPGKLPALLAEG